MLRKRNALYLVIGIFFCLSALSTFGYIGVSDSDMFNRSSVDYSLTDGLHLEAGIDIFAGDEGAFGQYEDNTEVWFKVKYSF